MREIKFRVWDGINVTNLDDEQGEFQVTFGMEGEWVIWSPEEQLNSDRYELMQYSGLKDKIGVEIYEGDIIKFSFKEGTKINSRYLEVVFESPSYRMKEIYRNYWLEKIGGVLELKQGILTKYKGELSNLYKTNEAYWVEVIGNIYENGELLNES